MDVEIWYVCIIERLTFWHQFMNLIIQVKTVKQQKGANVYCAKLRKMLIILKCLSISGATIISIFALPTGNYTFLLCIVCYVKWFFKKY